MMDPSAVGTPTNTRFNQTWSDPTLLEKTLGEDGGLDRLTRSSWGLSYDEEDILYYKEHVYKMNANFNVRDSAHSTGITKWECCYSGPEINR